MSDAIEPSDSEPEEELAESTSEDSGPPKNEEPTPVPEEPVATQHVHIFEHGKFLRTIERGFTDHEAESFVKVYSETGYRYGRKAFATEIGVEPPKELLS